MCFFECDLDRACARHGAGRDDLAGCHEELEQLARDGLIHFTASPADAPMRPGRYRSYLRYILSDTAALVSSLQRYQQTIATAHSVITGRFHATLFCLLSATPFVAVASNTGKIEAVLEDVFGCTSRLVPAEAIAGLSRVHVPTFTAAEDSLRQTYLSAARTRIGRMFDVIAATV
jgi:hypothetical protein